MKRLIAFTTILILSQSVFATTDHYIRKDGTLVQHLKITRTAHDINVSMDVDADNKETGHKACSAEVSGDGKVTGDNALSMKKQIEGETRHCLLEIKLSPEGAKVDQYADCTYFATGDCHFGSDGKELVRVK